MAEAQPRQPRPDRAYEVLRREVRVMGAAPQRGKLGRGDRPLQSLTGLLPAGREGLAGPLEEGIGEGARAVANEAREDGLLLGHRGSGLGLDALQELDCRQVVSRARPPAGGKAPIGGETEVARDDAWDGRRCRFGLAPGGMR